MKKKSDRRYENIIPMICWAPNTHIEISKVSKTLPRSMEQTIYIFVHKKMVSKSLFLHKKRIFTFFVVKLLLLCEQCQFRDLVHASDVPFRKKYSGVEAF